MSLSALVARQNEFNPLQQALGIMLQVRRMQGEDADRAMREDLRQEQRDRWRQQQEIDVQKFEFDKLQHERAEAYRIQKEVGELGKAYVDAYEIVDDGQGNVTGHQPPGGWNQFQADRGISPGDPRYRPNPPVTSGMVTDRIQKWQMTEAERKWKEAQAAHALQEPRGQNLIRNVNADGTVSLIDPATRIAYPVEGATAHVPAEPQGPTPHYSESTRTDAQGNPLLFNSLTGQYQPAPTGVRPSTKQAAAHQVTPEARIGLVNSTMGRYRAELSSTGYKGPDGAEITPQQARALATRDVDAELAAGAAQAPAAGRGGGGNSPPVTSSQRLVPPPNIKAQIDAEQRKAKGPRIIKTAKNPATGKRIGLGEDGQWYDLP